MQAFQSKALSITSAVNTCPRPSVSAFLEPSTQHHIIITLLRSLHSCLYLKLVESNGTWDLTLLWS